MLACRRCPLGQLLGDLAHYDRQPALRLSAAGGISRGAGDGPGDACGLLGDQGILGAMTDQAAPHSEKATTTVAISQLSRCACRIDVRVETTLRRPGRSALSVRAAKSGT